MKSFIKDELLVVAITHQEACLLNDGQTIADRRNPLWYEAKVEVHPFGHLYGTYQPVETFGTDDYWEQFRKLSCAVQFFANTDLAVYVPQELSRYALLGSETIARENIETLLKGDDRQGLLDTLPSRGVQIRFDSLE